MNLDREHLELLLQCSRLLGSSLDIQHVLGTLMDQAIEVLGAERGLILLREEETGKWTPRTVRALDTATLQSVEFRFSRGVVEEVIQTGRSVLTSDALEDERFRDSASVALYNLRSVLCVPLASGRPLGVIYVDNRLSTNTFGFREQALLEAIAQQAATALENALLYEKVNQEHKSTKAQLRQAGELVVEITTSLQKAAYDPLVAEATERCRTLVAQLSAQDQGEVVQWVEGSAVLLESAGRLAGLLEESLVLEAVSEAMLRLFPQAQADSNYRGPLLQRKRTLLVDEVAGSPLEPDAPPCRSLVLVPLKDSGLLATSEKPGQFTKVHLDLLVLLAFQAGSALDACRLHRESQESYARLIQSSKLAAVGQLAAGMAHELNTPLASVMLSLGSALRQLEKNPELAGQKIERARQTLETAKVIVEKLLYYSRDAGKGRKRCHLDSVVQDTLSFVRAPLLKDGVTVEVQPGAAPEVVCNANEIGQVLTNLLVNARDALVAAGRASSPIRLSLDGNSDWAVVRVTDQGGGIPAEVRAHIFDPFFTTKEPGQGTGLGLSISQEIAVQHGGRLEFETSSEGTQFRLLLPVAP